MKNRKLSIYLCLVAIAFVTFSTMSMAQDHEVRKSPKATVSQRIGSDTDVNIDYSRPGVKGRDIWGKLVPYGLFPGNKYSEEKPFPWRAGANENTTIEFNNDLIIEGKKVAAGKYSVHMIVSKTNIKVMLNKTNDVWGSYTYDASKNVLDVTVTPVASEHTEWLEYTFDDLSENSTTINLRWEKLSIPIEVKLAG